MLTYMPRWARRPPPRLSRGSKVATRLGESLEGPLVGGDQEVPGVLYALGAGKNTRMSIKDMLSEDEFSWATHVPWLIIVSNENQSN